ncbi:MAG: hypothetical protein ISS78_11815 [Phycisphaerae bacterium]|nr:hypothetical protein [Phycisphaerae bacterium]
MRQVAQAVRMGFFGASSAADFEMLRPEHGVSRVEAGRSHHPVYRYFLLSNSK